MTGCPNGCARPYMGDIGIVGRTKDIYNMYVGGDWGNTRLNTLYAASVHMKNTWQSFILYSRFGVTSVCRRRR